MLIVQLFIFAILALAFGTFAYLRKKKFVGVLFLLLGFFLLVVGLITVYFYPQTWPW